MRKYTNSFMVYFSTYDSGSYLYNRRLSTRLWLNSEVTWKKVKRKVQGMPQSQTATNPRHQEEEKKDKNIHAQNKQTNVREAQRPAPSSPSEVCAQIFLHHLLNFNQWHALNPYNTECASKRSLHFTGWNVSKHMHKSFIQWNKKMNLDFTCA